MKVTVYILVYNDPVLVARAIQSVLAQTHSNLEIVLLDNGSTDSTPDILKTFSTDSRISIVTNTKNQRSEFAAREAMSCKSKFLSFLFSDDFYEPTRIEKMLEPLSKDATLAAAFSNNYLVDESGTVLHEILPTIYSGDVSAMDSDEHLNHLLFLGNSLHPCSMLIRCDVYRKLGGFLPFLHRIGDMTFFAKLLSHESVTFVSEKLQRITVLTSKRNESFQNAINTKAVAFERTYFLKEYRSDAFLNRAEYVFPEIREKIGATRDLGVRQFCVGQIIFRIQTVDHRLMGFLFMYDAFSRSPAAVDGFCCTHLGISFAQYCYHLEQKHVTHLSLVFYKLRNWVHNLPGGRWLISILRPAIRQIRAN